jgi:hypothetical protein
MATKTRQPQGVYVDGCGKETTLAIPHREVKCDRGTFLIGQLPEGDWSVHKLNGDGHGYGGDVISFLMEDGSIREFKGPYHTESEYESISKAVGFDVSKPVASRITVGKNLFSGQYNGTREVVYEETLFSIDDVKSRLQPSWRGMEVLVMGRHCGRYYKVSEILDQKETN